jgi:hypothetical protein
MKVILIVCAAWATWLALISLKYPGLVPAMWHALCARVMGLA